MTDLNDRSYYIARANASRESAGRARNPEVAAIHLELAERYENILARIELSRTARSGSLAQSAMQVIFVETSNLHQLAGVHELRSAAAEGHRAG